MEKEHKASLMMLATMYEMVMNDSDAVLFGYALAISKGGEDDLEIAKYFKERAEKLGITDEQLTDAVSAMKKTDEFLDSAS